MYTIPLWMFGLAVIVFAGILLHQKKQGEASIGAFIVMSYLLEQYVDEYGREILDKKHKIVDYKNYESKFKIDEE
jgi:hypothetical protein